jgi:hypothetical protein
MKDSALDAAGEAIKASPPIGMTLAWFAGLPVEKWLVLVTIAYTCLLILHRLWHWRHPPKGK